MNGKALYAGEDQWCAVQGRDWVQVGDRHHHAGKSHNQECGGYPPWGDDTNNKTYGNSTWNDVVLYKKGNGGGGGGGGELTWTNSTEGCWIATLVPIPWIWVRR